MVNFNAEWLFLRGGHGRLQCPGPDCTWTDRATADMHLQRVARVLRQLDGDIVNLTEVEDCLVLKALIAAIGDPSYRPFLVRSSDTALGQNLGLISRVDPEEEIFRTNARLRFPIPDSVCPRGQGGQSTTLSKHYIAKFKLFGSLVSVIGVHLLARPTDPGRCAKREAQAVLLGQIIRRAHRPHEELIVLGDFNDFDPDLAAPQSRTGPNSAVPFSPVLSLVRNAAQPALFNALALVSPPLSRYSAWWDRNGNCRDDGPREHCLIDHVLVSAGLRTKLSRVWIAHGLFNATCDPTERVSDHWPVVVDFEKD